MAYPDTGEIGEGFFTAYITANHPIQFDAYAIEMAKGVIAGMHRASMERDVMAIVCTAAGEGD